MPDRFQTAEEAILKTLKLHPQLTMPQCHRVSGLEDRTESRRLVDQLTRDGILILVDEGGTRFYSRSPELGMDDPPRSPEPVPPPIPEPPTPTAPAKVEAPAETRPTVQSTAETRPPAIVSPPHVKTSRYPGVCFDRTTQRWRSFCTVGGKTKNLGSNYPSEEAAFRAREAFVQEHHIQSRPLATDAVPKAQEATAPSPGGPAVTAEHTIHVCRLAVYSASEKMRQELVIDRMVRAELAAARTAGHAGAVVIYSDESGNVTGRETVKF